ncbi:MAG TPA: LysM peptidoglycan-binding domain-containing protein [Gemmatimonadaceae bacterium]|jgi:LysM repeat protein|nr:LysM peptidoglycan-binding domain-containing protein [Gemmatimonadaceae bacterium]
MLVPVRGPSRRLSLRGGLALSLALSATVSFAARAQQTADPAPKTHTVKRGDTLWDIAKLYLTDPFLWPEVYRLNTDVIEDPHWIYPGEILKLPGEPAKVVAVAPPAPAPAPAPAIPQAAEPPKPAPAPRDSVVVVNAVQAPTSVVRVGEFVAAPWVDENGGPRRHGYIVESAELPGIASADRSRVRLYDRVFIAQPDTATGRKLYLTYRLGPMLTDFGQIVIPTGVIEVPRPAQPGEAAVGRVVRMFDEMLEGQRLIPLDTSAAIVSGRPTRIADGMHGMVRWVGGEPVLGTVQTYVVIDISRRDSLTAGDQIELYKPRQKPTEGRDLALPEISIARAQVLRVTPYGATAIVFSQEQPKVEQGAAVRVSAKMP